LLKHYKWYSLAAANGHSLSLKDRAIIRMRMSAAQISKAEGLAREFQQVKNQKIGQLGSLQ